jgi:hypothetical protein
VQRNQRQLNRERQRKAQKQQRLQIAWQALLQHERLQARQLESQHIERLLMLERQHNRRKQHPQRAEEGIQEKLQRNRRPIAPTPQANQKI